MSSLTLKLRFNPLTFFLNSNFDKRFSDPLIVKAYSAPSYGKYPIAMYKLSFWAEWADLIVWFLS